MRTGPACPALRRWWREHAPVLGRHVRWAVPPRGFPTSLPGVRPPTVDSAREQPDRCRARQDEIEHRDDDGRAVVLLLVAGRGGCWRLCPRHGGRPAADGRDAAVVIAGCWPVGRLGGTHRR